MGSSSSAETGGVITVQHSSRAGTLSGSLSRPRRKFLGGMMMTFLLPTGFLGTFLRVMRPRMKSDTLEGFCKTALRRTLLRDPDLAIITADDLVTAVKHGLVQRRALKALRNTHFLLLRLFPSLTDLQTPWN